MTDPNPEVYSPDHTSSATDAVEATPVSEPPAASEARPDPADTRAERRQDRDTPRYRAQLRAVEAERDQLRQQVADLQRAEIARETGVPVAEITGDDVDAMRASADVFAARVAGAVEAELARRGINAAAPASAVGQFAEHPDVDSRNDFVDAFRPPR